MENVEARVVVVPHYCQDFIELFLSNRRRDLMLIDHAIGQQDWEEIYEAGHRLKGSGESFGFGWMTEAGAALEKLAKEKNGDEVIRLVGRLRRELDAVKVVFKAV